MGSSLGNYQPTAAVDLLRQMRQTLRPQDYILLGVDTVYKAAEDILLAYDDPAGWSALFNLNTLHNVNKSLGTDFPVDQYEHVVEYDGETLHTLARAKQTHVVKYGEQHVRVEVGTKLEMEISDKYNEEKVRKYGEQSGLAVVEFVFTDDRKFMWAIMRRANDGSN